MAATALPSLDCQIIVVRLSAVGCILPTLELCQSFALVPGLPNGLNTVLRSKYFQPQRNGVRFAYGNKIFLAVGLNGGASNVAATTSNMGVTWTARELPEYDIWFTITFGNGVFVLAAYLSDKALTTVNGLVWTQRALPVSATWYSIGYGNKNFVAVGYGTAAAALIGGISNSPQMIDTNFIISYTGQVVSY